MVQKNLNKHFASVREVIRQTTDTAASGLTTRTLSVFESGALILLDKDEAYAITLPKITVNDIGVHYDVMQTLASNNARTFTTAYDNDYFIGSIATLPSAAWGATDAQDGLVMNMIADADASVLTLDDNAGANASYGAVGTTFKLTAVLTGNIAAGGGSKLVWAITGVGFTADPDSTGVTVFTS